MHEACKGQISETNDVTLPLAKLCLFFLLGWGKRTGKLDVIVWGMRLVLGGLQHARKIQATFYNVYQVHMAFIFSKLWLQRYELNNPLNQLPVSWAAAATYSLATVFPLVSTLRAQVLVATRHQHHIRFAIQANNTSRPLMSPQRGCHKIMNGGSIFGHGIRHRF